MTSEEKLHKLLKISVNNGFDITALPPPFSEWLYNIEKSPKVIQLTNCLTFVNGYGVLEYPIDSLIGSFETNETSFLEGLLEACPNKSQYYNYLARIDGYTQSGDENVTGFEAISLEDECRFLYFTTSLSKRLENLFEQFNQLLR
jgi:hypothetical protein